LQVFQKGMPGIENILEFQYAELMFIAGYPSDGMLRFPSGRFKTT